MPEDQRSVNLDPLLPPDMARKAEDIGVKKVNLDVGTKFALALLAGAFIAFGAIFTNVVWTGAATAPWGWSRLLGGIAFSVGLILVIISGAALFTGNNLIVMAWASRRVTSYQLIRNWSVVYVGNFVGSLGIALLVFWGRHYMADNGAVGATALNIALAKVHLGFVQALCLGILCNTLVCLAVWMTYSARSTACKVAVIIPPISAFVAAGFEHSVANMYFIPVGLFIKSAAPQEFWSLPALAGKTAAQYADLTWTAFLLNNLLPVTLGNIIGGSLFVGAVYWWIYLRPKSQGA